MNGMLFTCKTALSLTFSATLLAVSMQSAQATLLTPSQTPLILSESVAPNMFFTLDDSGSMRWAYVPDSADSLSETRRAKSSTFNPMYYNPSVTYPLPVKYEADGARSSTQYSTTFSAAYFNGFNTALGSIDLSNSYRATWSYNPSTTPRTSGLGGSDFGDQFTSNSYAANPAADFGGATISTQTVPGNSGSDTFIGTASSGMNNNETRDLTADGVTFRVTRTSTTACTATLITTSATGAPVTTTQADTPSAGLTTSVSTIRTTNYLPPVTCSRNRGTYTLGSATTFSESVTTTVTSADRTRAAVPAYYYRYDTSLAGCSSNTADDNCYRLVTVSATSGTPRADDSTAGTDERANFARWYSFYRNRALTTLSAANIAFTGLPSSIRLSWQRLNTCNSFNDSSCKNYLRKFSQYQRGNFFSWLAGSPFSGGTALRTAQQRVGEFITTSDAWAFNPYPLSSTGTTGTTVQSPEYSCRANYHLLMTDGMWNGSDGTPSATLKPDHSDATLPDSVSYTQQRPYADETTNTLADLAFHYWATDASSSLTNDMKPIIQAPNSTAATQYWDPRNDPATWQHLTTFTVGIGLNAALNDTDIPWTGDTTSGSGYDALKAGTQSWPTAGSDSSNNVYDLWHAALNSRGDFFSADTPESIVNAFREIISRISNRTTSAGAPGVTASIVQDALNREVYETKFNSEDWSGDLTKFNISEAGVRTARWSAQTQLDAQTPSSRNIKFYSATAINNLQDFTWSNLSSTEQAMLNRNFDTSTSPADSRGSERVAYLRGDQSQEGSASGAFRIRSSVLGDIVNSSPVIVAAPKYISYLADKVDGSTGDYEEFKTDNASRTPMIYVGSNDGMLHGFNANTGQEAFAFVPRAVMPNMYKLTSQRYTGGQHHFFVDGTPTVADVYYDNAWHTVLVGTLRAGGRSIFALDITNPSSIKLLWEKSSSDTGFANLGYTFAQPVIARLHTGKWAVVTGNGYGNQDGATADVASLMVLDIETGAMVKEMVVTGDNTVANGLSSPRLADNNSDGIADYAYAGDLQGNMWRFDLVPTQSTAINGDPFNKTLIGNIDASSFAIAYGGRPLYTTRDDRASGATSQAITAPPSLVRHPSGTGYIVAFGTGKYFESTDGNVDSTRAMTLYGIWDEKTRRQSTSAPSSALNRTNLQQQTITSQPSTNPFSSNNAVQGIRIVSDNAVDWTTKKGWYLDLKVGSTRAGEMMINPMAARGKTLLLSTLTPNSNPCQEGVESWLYGLDATTGGRTRYNVFDLNNDKIINNQDMASVGGTNTVVSSYKKPGSGGFTTNTGDIFTAPSQGGGVKYSGGPGSSGRQSWRVIPED